MKLEEKMKELEGILERLESEDISLEESIELFQKAVNLYKECRKDFNEMKMKVIDVMKELESDSSNSDDTMKF